MIEVAIIDDNQELQANLATLLEGTPGFACVSTYSDCETALANLASDQPDVILLDIGFEGRPMSGIDAVWPIKQILPKVEIIMMTVRTDHASVFQALKYGANGYLVKDVPKADLLSAIETIYKGGSPMSMPIARMVTNSFHHHQCFDELSARQREVLEKLCEGKSYKAIANALYIDLATVKFHIRNIYRILQVSNRAEAMLKYAQNKR